MTRNFKERRELRSCLELRDRVEAIESARERIGRGPAVSALHGFSRPSQRDITAATAPRLRRRLLERMIRPERGE